MMSESLYLNFLLLSISVLAITLVYRLVKLFKASEKKRLNEKSDDSKETVSLQSTTQIPEKSDYKYFLKVA